MPGYRIPAKTAVAAVAEGGLVRFTRSLDGHAAAANQRVRVDHMNLVPLVVGVGGFFSRAKFQNSALPSGVTFPCRIRHPRNGTPCGAESTKTRAGRTHLHSDYCTVRTAENVSAARSTNVSQHAMRASFVVYCWCMNVTELHCTCQALMTWLTAGAATAAAAY